MSAFLVEYQTINTIVNWIRSETFLVSEIPYKLKRLGIAMSKAGWEERLGHAMAALNTAAVTDRYGIEHPATIRQHPYRYEQTAPVPFVQVLKSLQCWLYQCCEGDVPEEALYKLFDHDVRVYLMDKIIRMLPEYEKAYWG